MNTKLVYFVTLGNRGTPSNHGIVTLREDNWVHKREWEGAGDDGWQPIEDFGYSAWRNISEGPYPTGDELFNYMLGIVQE